MDERYVRTDRQHWACLRQHAILGTLMCPTCAAFVRHMTDPRTDDITPGEQYEHRKALLAALRADDPRSSGR